MFEATRQSNHLRGMGFVQGTGFSGFLDIWFRDGVDVGVPQGGLDDDARVRVLDESDRRLSLMGLPPLPR